jgi:signal transduction histidine kinase
MSEDTVARIFEPFFTTRGSTNGTGLGLALVRAIVDRHQGEIAVESQVGEGTTFTVEFPRGAS